MDLNKSVESNVNSTASPQLHNFIPMPSFLLPYHQGTKEESEKARHSHFMQRQKQNLDLFWNRQLLDIHNASDFKGHQLPLARIKKIMKADDDVKMISADTPILFAKACELFIMELTLRAWMETEECGRKTLQRSDIARAIGLCDILDFLLDVVPINHPKDDEPAKDNAEMESLSTMQVSYPFLSINGDSEVSPQLGISLSMPMVEFDHASVSKEAK